MEAVQGDYLIYLVHVIAWGSVGATRLVHLSRDRAQVLAPVFNSQTPLTAPYSCALVGLHALGFGVIYFGLGQAVISGQVPRLFPFQRLVGALVIVAGTGLMCWAMVFLRSWRILAKIEPGHELATGGPFALIRHPLYAGINLVGLGTALWVPTAIEFTAVVLLAVGGDLRARSEENLLIQAFGEPYRVYMDKTKRFIPGVY